MDDIIVELKNVNFRYMASEQDTLQDVSLTIKRGEFVGIIGPAGAGKTTLVSCIKGLIPHTINGKLSGSVQVCGENTKKVTPDKLAENVGMVMQNPEGQIIGLTVIEDLAFGPENFQRPPHEILAKIPKVLETVRLSGYEQRDTFGLSGGQKQRLSIAGALIMDPILLILDEPTSELDPIGREEVFTTVRRLRDEFNFTVIVVEQAVEELVGVCDRIVVMKDGRIVADDTPASIFRNKNVFWGDRQGEVPIPQIVELLYKLSDAGYISENRITPNEHDAAEILAELLKKV